jgi:hypothetical protein
MKSWFAPIHCRDHGYPQVVEPQLGPNIWVAPSVTSRNSTYFDYRTNLCLPVSKKKQAWIKQGG